MLKQRYYNRCFSWCWVILIFAHHCCMSYILYYNVITQKTTLRNCVVHGYGTLATKGIGKKNKQELLSHHIFGELISKNPCHSPEEEER